MGHAITLSKSTARRTNTLIHRKELTDGLILYVTNVLAVCLQTNIGFYFSDAVNSFGRKERKDA